MKQVKITFWKKLNEGNLGLTFHKGWKQGSYMVVGSEGQTYERDFDVKKQGRVNCSESTHTSSMITSSLDINPDTTSIMIACSNIQMASICYCVVKNNHQSNQRIRGRQIAFNDLLSIVL